MSLFLRRASVPIVLASLLACAGGPGAELEGRWEGTVKQGGGTRMMLLFETKEDRLTGTFSVISQTGEDIDLGHTVPLADLEIEEQTIRFLVPLSGTVDQDSLAFELTLEGERLRGGGREFREGSRYMEVDFERVETD